MPKRLVGKRKALIDQQRQMLTQNEDLDDDEFDVEGKEVSLVYFHWNMMTVLLTCGDRSSSRSTMALGKWRPISLARPRSLVVLSMIVVFLIAKWQNGLVPKNRYGNVWLYKPEMLPKGCRHVQLENLMRIARRLGIDCAPAMVFAALIEVLLQVVHFLFPNTDRMGAWAIPSATALRLYCVRARR